MGGKKHVSLLIDQETFEKARALGINVSKACENYLKQLIDAIENANQLNRQKISDPATAGSGMVRPPGFEPGSSTWQTAKIDWIMFKEYVEKDHRPRVAQQICSNAENYAVCLLNRDLSVLQGMSAAKRSNILKSLSSLAKFLGVYEEWRQLVRSYGFKWVGKSADDLIIERLNRVADPEEVWRWIRDVKVARPDLAEFMDLMALTGLRLVEGVCSYNLIIKLSREGKLDSYYIHEHGALEHYRFKELFIRKSKKAFVSFVPTELVSAISKKEILTSADAVQKLVQKRGLPLRFADIREAHGTFMTKFLKPSEIDFLHGRVTSSVFMQHYFNPALIGDLRERAFKGITEILEKVKI